MNTTKNCKRLLLLWVLMVNLLPCIKDGDVTWTTMRVEAQQYIVELPSIPPGTIPPVPECQDLSNNMGLNYIGGYAGKPWCGILLLASLTSYTPEYIAEWYADYMGITVEEISGTANEESWYPSFGVSIGPMLTTREKCDIIQLLHDAGPSTGLFIVNSGHVYVIYELNYLEVQHDNSGGLVIPEHNICWKYDTASAIRNDDVSWDEITSITDRMYLISK